MAKRQSPRHDRLIGAIGTDRVVTRPVRVFALEPA
jgi:hypothetical protein